jgi:hypothetical protein
MSGIANDKPDVRLNRGTRGAVAVLSIAGALALGGCYHPEARLDTITPVAGNASAHNKAVQTIDPWPPEAFRRSQTTDGERVRQAYESYRGAGGGGGGDNSAPSAPADNDLPTAPGGAAPGSS